MKDVYTKEEIINSLLKMCISEPEDILCEGAMKLVADILKVSEEEVAEMLYDGTSVTETEGGDSDG